jgi:transcription elongation factor GreB
LVLLLERTKTLFVLTTNQGVVGSIPASRTKKLRPVIAKSQAFFLFYICRKPSPRRLYPPYSMNKAFTKESDNADDDDDLQLPPILGGGKNYISPKGYTALRNEWLDLMDNERPKIVEAVFWAASNGDRSENGDYIYGKKRLREIDRRIRFLTKRLEIAEIANPSAHHGNDQIFFGATVTYADEVGQERTVTIVGIDEANSAVGEVSWISPIARTLLKAHVGDVLKLVMPGKVAEIEVLNVSYPVPDAI